MGSVLDEVNGLGSGSAYIFRRDGTKWVQQAKLLPSDGAMEDNFGFSVGVSNNTAIVGAWHDDDLGRDSGSGYFFHAPPLCRADLFEDGKFNIFDFLAFLDAFNAQQSIADFNGDRGFYLR